jgi:hypothetical protein
MALAIWFMFDALMPPSASTSSMCWLMSYAES